MKPLEDSPLTKNISLDTSFFVGQNFLVGTMMKTISELSQKKEINVFITDITYREVLANFGKKMNEAIEKMKKSKEAIERGVYIFRNFKELSPFFELPEVDLEKYCHQFNQDFDFWLHDNTIKIVPTGHLIIEDVFKDYFENKPPFKDSQNKKHEFPDAFALKALIEYFKKKNEKTYFLTNDKDFSSEIDEIIIPTSDYSALMDLIIRSSPEKRREKAIDLIESGFTKYREKLNGETKEMINSAIEENMTSIVSWNHLEVASLEYVKVSDISLDNFAIVSLDIDKRTAKLISEIDFSFEVGFFTNNMDDGWFDKDDMKYHYSGESEFHILNDKDIIPINISVNFNIETDEIEMKVVEINEGKGIDAMYSFKG